MSRLHMLAVAALVACGGSQRVHKKGEEYLAEIKIEGNKELDDKTLRRGLASNRTLAAGRAVDEYQVSLDVSRISGAYQRLGYFSAQVRSHVAHHGDATTLIFTVTEGPRATAVVEITGLPPEVPPEQARELVKIDDGEPFNYGRFDSAKQPMLALVENAGYAHAQLDAQVLADRATNRATVRYAFDSGPRVKFGEITIAGVDGALAEAARSRATFEPGEWYSARELAATQQAIYGVKRFSSVRIDVDRTSDAPVLPVRIIVAEAKRLEVRLGGGAGLDALTYQVRLRGSVTYAGWPSPLTTLGVEFKPAYTVLRDNCDFYEVWACDYEPRVRLLGTITQQDFLRKHVRGEVEGGLDYLALEAFTTQGARARLGIGAPLGTTKIEARLGWLFGYYYFPDDRVDDATAAAIGIDHIEQLGAFTQAVVLDYRDNPIEPTFGTYAELRFAEGGRYAAGDYRYLQITPEWRGYVPFSRFVLAARARLGVIRGDVPPTERYYAGGAASQRGFSERRLSPTALAFDEDGNPILDDDDNQTSVVIGGAALLETGVELRTRFHLFGTNMGGVVFLDGGDVTMTPGELDVGNLHWAVGAGIRPYYLPVGPIRIEVAYRLNRFGAGEPSPGNRFNFLLSVGEAF